MENKRERELQIERIDNETISVKTFDDNEDCFRYIPFKMKIHKVCFWEKAKNVLMKLLNKSLGLLP